MAQAYSKKGLQLNTIDTHIKQCCLMSHVFVICKIECITVQLVTQSNKLIQHPKVLEITYNVKYHNTKVWHTIRAVTKIFQVPEQIQQVDDHEVSNSKEFLSVLFFFFSFFMKVVRSHFQSTLEPRFNEPLHNKVFCITNNFFQPGQNYNKMYGTEPWYNEPWFNEILIIRNTIQKCKHIEYTFVTTNKY